MSVIMPGEAMSTGYSGEPHYDLPEDELRRLAISLFANSPPPVGERLAMYRVDGNSPEANLGRAVEREVFESTFGNDATEMAVEYGPYEGASEFFVVLDTDNAKVVGAVRVIKNSPAGLKSLNDIEASLGLTKEMVQAYHGINSLDNTWDIGTMAILPEYRRFKDHIISSALYRAIYTTSLDENVEHYVSLVDSHVHKLVKILGFPFVPINGSEPFSYLGSESSTAIYGHVPDFREAVEGNLARTRLYNPVVGHFLAKHVLRISEGKQTDKMLVFPH